jgi:hypothetical protein
VDKVYYFSKCQVKPANKQFNTIKNEYEMTLNSDSVIEECLNDDGVVPQVKYNFVPIDSVASMDVGALVDVIGICKEASDIQTFTSRSTNCELKKRDVFLVDQSKTAVMIPHNCPPVDKVEFSDHFDSVGFPGGFVRRDQQSRRLDQRGQSGGVRGRQEPVDRDEQSD